MGQIQITGNPTNVGVPSSQCGAASGFEVYSGGWQPIDKMAIGADGVSLILNIDMQGVRGQGTKLQIRYLFADWPVPTVYNWQSFLWTNGELPVAPFVMDVDGGNGEGMQP